MLKVKSDIRRITGREGACPALVLSLNRPALLIGLNLPEAGTENRPTDGVLRRLRRLDKKARGRGRRKKLETIRTSANHLEKRRETINNDELKRSGYPIGGGGVESANKLVVESRMKQGGMRGRLTMLIRCWHCETSLAMTAERKHSHN